MTGATIHVIEPVALRTPATPPCSAAVTASDPPAVKPGPLSPEETPSAKVETASSQADGAAASAMSAISPSRVPVRSRRCGDHRRRGTTSSWVIMAPAALASSMRPVTDTAVWAGRARRS